MIFLLTLYLLIYLLVSYLSIYQYSIRLTRILRIILSIGLLLFSFSLLVGITATSWWVFLLVLALVINIEITAFKHRINDQKGVLILHIFTLMLTVLIIGVSFFNYSV
ncbi:membrane stabilizing protein MspA [Macrococcus equipercicus]|uniref:Membrane stabilizing protein MspA n=1 Tax=Macrococcus equipercicus TaxID=69967 RepID=A0A9Q9BLZ3_9STAP|nr:membrane stabilizing protein MspA [Macrococcus equipercicus]UTH13998.1 membrane stabilizing protein MspA [Macrococcus equipercicus]